MLDENPTCGMKAPSTDHPNTIWYNICVPNIKETFQKAIEAGCVEVQKITEITSFGVSIDQFGRLLYY